MPLIALLAKHVFVLLTKTVAHAFCTFFALLAWERTYIFWPKLLALTRPKGCTQGLNLFLRTSYMTLDDFLVGKEKMFSM